MDSRAFVPQWEVAFQGCKWWTLDLVLSQFIQRAKDRGDNIVQYTWLSPSGETKTYEINFETMLQINQYSKRKRSVRVIWREHPLTGFDQAEYDGSS
jgi:hypothetical protein